LTLKHFRTLRHVSILIDHHQGVRRCLFKVNELKKITEFKILKSQSWWCGSTTFIMCAWRSVWTERHAHVINVMLPHHHDWLLRILNSVIF